MRYAKTAQGQEVIKARSMALSAKQRTMLLLCDGARSIDDILSTTSGMGSSAADVDELVQRGLIEPRDGAPSSPAMPASPATLVPSPPSATPDAAEAPSPADVAPSASSDADRYREAYQLATQLTSQLGFKGFRLQLAVESAMTLVALNALLPRLSEALVSAHGPKQGAEQVAQLKRALRGT